MHMTGHQVRMSLIILVAVVLNIGLNWFLIPLYGIDGAAFASMASVLIWNALASDFIRKRYRFLMYPH